MRAHNIVFICHKKVFIVFAGLHYDERFVLIACCHIEEKIITAGWAHEHAQNVVFVCHVARAQILLTTAKVLGRSPVRVDERLFLAGGLCANQWIP